MLFMNNMIRLTKNFRIFLAGICLALTLNKYLNLIPLTNGLFWVVFIITIGLFILTSILEKKMYSKNRHEK